MWKRATEAVLRVLLLSLPWAFMDLMTRGYVQGTDFGLAYMPANLFSLAWIVLVVGLTVCLKGKWGKCLYWCALIPFLILFITHTIYYKMTSFYFSFGLMALAGEGSDYLLDTIVHADWWIWPLALALAVLAAFGLHQLPKLERVRWRSCLCVVAVSGVSFLIGWLCLGKSYKQLTWSSFRNPRHIYEDFSDVNKSMRVAGLYQYTFRNLYKTLNKNQTAIDPADLEFLDQAYQTAEPEKNAYTGIFEGKNVIFLQMEGMDDWVLTPETTPNLYALQQQSIDFTKHYSMYTGGGSTFNSEFAVNTGFTTPISYEENVYSYHKNLFDQSLPKQFGALGYRTNAFHMNSGEFYSRNLNYLSWGYDHYYGLLDLKNFHTLEYTLDRMLIEDADFYDLMFRQGEPFLDYIITYTPHMPFSLEGNVCSYIAEQLYGEDIPELDEEACVRMMAQQTDIMVGLLMDALKREGLYENTVIVAFADHYLYTISDKSILARNKNTRKNLINHTPFFIWSSDVTPTKIDQVTMQTNILPTVLNLFGVDYDPNAYLCADALAPDYAGFAFFSDYSCYDGRKYMEDEAPQQVLDVIRKNDLTLKTDYFRRRAASN